MPKSTENKEGVRRALADPAQVRTARFIYFFLRQTHCAVTAVRAEMILKKAYLKTIHEKLCTATTLENRCALFNNILPIA